MQLTALLLIQNFKKKYIAWSKYEDPFSNSKIHAFGQDILFAYRLVLLNMLIHYLFNRISLSFTLTARARSLSNGTRENIEHINLDGMSEWVRIAVSTDSYNSISWHLNMLLAFHEDKKIKIRT